MSLELKIEANGEGSNAKKGVANLGISEEKKVVEATLEVTTGVLEKIDISIERTEENILAIQMNINEEKNKEEVVVIRIKN